MSTTIPAQQPRRRLWRWVVGLGLGALVLVAAWKVVMRNQAISELRAAGFDYQGRPNVWRVVRHDWRGLFRRQTWHVAPVAMLQVGDARPPLPNLNAIGPALRRLEIETLYIELCPELQNLDALTDLPALKVLLLYGCFGLNSVDGLKGLPALQTLDLGHCTALENIDVLHDLTSLREINLSHCAGLSHESVAALEAALPNTAINAP